MSAFDAMPKRAIRVLPPRDTLGWSMMAVVFLPLLGIFGAPVWHDLRTDLTMPGNSPRAYNAAVTVTCTRSPLLHLCEANVRYSARNEVRTATIATFTIWNKPPPGRFTVDYDRADPSRIKVEWPVDIGFSRLLSFIAMALVVLAGTLYTLRCLWVMARASRLRPGLPVLADVLDIRPVGRADVAIVFVWSAPDGMRLQGTARMPGALDLLWADPLMRRAVALVDAAGAVTAVDAGLRLVRLTRPEKAAVLAAA